jgi:hypothetical protein
VLVVIDQREVTPELDRRRQLAMVVMGAADRGRSGVVDSRT